MNIKYDNIDRMIQDYVLGRLSDAQAMEFEEFFLPDADVAKQVEAAIHLRAGLQEIERSDQQKSVAPNSTKIKDTNSNAFKQSSDKSLYEKLIGLISIPVPAFAVLAMAAVMSPMVLKGLSSFDSNSNINLISFSTDATRSANDSIIVDLSGINGNSAILIKLKTVEFPRYKLKLIPTEENGPSWESEPFQPSSLRDKLITLPASTFGKVKVEVVGIDDKSHEQNVEFCNYSETCK